MKYVITIILILTFFISNHSQEKLPPGELLIHMVDRPFPNPWEVEVELEALGTVWDCEYDIDAAGDYTGGTQTITEISQDWWYQSSACFVTEIHEPFIALGLYKITVTYESEVAWLIIDWRSKDLVIEAYNHNFNDQDYEYHLDDKTITYTGGSTSLNGFFLNIWDEIAAVDLVTTGLEDYWDNCLVAIRDDPSDHPVIVWGPYPGTLGGPIDNYKVYYSQHNHGSPPGVFSLLATVDDDVYEYIDNAVTIGTDLYDRSYRIMAAYTDIDDEPKETSPTNFVTFQLNPPSKIGLDNVGTEAVMIYDFNLSQNYPNPFNPITTISYSIRYSGLVTLKIYDVLGNVVETLVNENKSQGIHKVQFDASKLPSSIYFYEISTEKYNSVRKMLLLK